MGRKFQAKTDGQTYMLRLDLDNAEFLEMASEALGISVNTLINDAIKASSKNFERAMMSKRSKKAIELQRELDAIDDILLRIRGEE